MFRRISTASVTVVLALFIAGTAAAYPGGSDKNNSNSGGGNNKSSGNTASGGNSSASGGSSNRTGPSSSSKTGSSGGNTPPGGSNNGPIHINTNPGNRQGGSNSVNSGGKGGNSANKVVLKSNPAPKVLNSNTAKNVLPGKDHSTDHSKDHSSDHSKENGSKSTSHDHSGDKHYHGNPHYAYHHEKGQKWDKNEWNHCWSRWWYFHNSHQYINGSWCWWDPDVSQWSVYREGDSIAEDYLVKDEAPPAANAANAAIRVELPGDAEAPLSYALNEYNFDIKPGDHQDLTTERNWVIAFNRGGDFGDAEYTLESGVYTFGPSDHGWDLFHTSE